METPMETLHRMAGERCPILGGRQPEARAAEWAIKEIERLRALKQPAMPTRDEIIKLWDLAMLETATGLDAMEYFTRAVLVPNTGGKPRE